MDLLLNELSRQNPPSRSLLSKIAAYVVTEKDIQLGLANVILLVNTIEGPQVRFDPVRRCYGLFADQDYEGSSRFVTEYGGSKSHREVDGDYSAKIGKAGSFFIDGAFGFKIKEKGRWINEFDAQRKFVNVELGRNVRTTVGIQAGEQFFADYGNEYIRNY